MCDSYKGGLALPSESWRVTKTLFNYSQKRQPKETPEGGVPLVLGRHKPVSLWRDWGVESVLGGNNRSSGTLASDTVIPETLTCWFITSSIPLSRGSLAHGTPWYRKKLYCFNDLHGIAAGSLQAGRRKMELANRALPSFLQEKQLATPHHQDYTTIYGILRCWRAQWHVAQRRTHHYSFEMAWEAATRFKSTKGNSAGESLWRNSSPEQNVFLSVQLQFFFGSGWEFVLQPSRMVVACDLQGTCWVDLCSGVGDVSIAPQGTCLWAHGASHASWCYVVWYQLKSPGCGMPGGWGSGRTYIKVIEARKHQGCDPKDTTTLSHTGILNMDGCRDHQRRVSKGGKRVGRMEIGWGKKGQVLVLLFLWFMFFVGTICNHFGEFSALDCLLKIIMRLLLLVSMLNNVWHTHSDIVRVLQHRILCQQNQGFKIPGFFS